MQFFPFRRQRASGACARDRFGALRRALDDAGIAYMPANPLAALTRIPSSAAPLSPQPAPRQRFESPLPWPAKTAFFTDLFLSERNAPSPDLLVMPLNEALELTLRSAGAASAIVVITSIADAPLADHHRDLLWRSLGLPVFEQLTAWNGSVIARECEIHDGLHVAEDVILEVESSELIVTLLKEGESLLRARTGIAGELAPMYCECGRETPRLKTLALMPANEKAMGAQSSSSVT